MERIYEPSMGDPYTIDSLKEIIIVDYDYQSCPCCNSIGFEFDDGQVFESKKWTKMKITEILDRLIDSKISDLNSVLDEYHIVLNKKTRNKIKEAIENFDHTKPNARNKLKTYLKPILNTHRDIILKTQKMTKK